MKHPKTWITLAFLALILTLIMIIITMKRLNEEHKLQERIYNHSEIVDPV